MRCCWIISQDLQEDPLQRYQKLGDLAPTWGSWVTWRAFSTDNSICTNLAEADKLLSRAFQSVTNLYLPRDFFAELGNPRGVKLFDGTAPENTSNVDDIAAISITSQLYDIVLLLGFEFSEDARSDQIYTTMAGQDRCQFVLVDNPKSPDQRFQDLANFTCDKYANVLELLA